MKITDDFCYEGKPSPVPTTKLILFGTQKRALVNPQRKHCMYSSKAKGTSWAEVMSNNKTSKL